MINSFASTKPITTPFDNIVHVADKNGLTAKPNQTPFDDWVHVEDKNGLTAKGMDISKLVRIPDKDGFVTKQHIPDGACHCDDCKKEPAQWGKVAALTLGGAAILTLIYGGKGIMDKLKNLIPKK